jgi:hypothetical protein
LALAEPPYWMRISSAVFWSTFFAIQSRMACRTDGYSAKSMVNAITLHQSHRIVGVRHA